MSANTKQYTEQLVAEFFHVTPATLLEFSVTGYKGMHILDFDKLAQYVLGGDLYDHSYYREGTAGYRLFDHLSYNLGVAYYARPRESFDNLQGQLEAVERGQKFIILEDMS